MRRDFSEAAERSLCGQIQEINAEQWYGWTDALGDLFEFGLDIQDYLYCVDVYHKKIMDKNNTTVEEISKIFSEVRAVDSSYQSIFSKCRESLREQKEYIKALADCIDVSRSNFTVDGIHALMALANRELTDSKVEYFIGKLRFGNGDQNYDFEYLTEIMNMNPEDVPKDLYAALILTFNDMSLEQKEKFIECSYILGGFYTDTSQNIGSGKYQFKISDVFLVTVAAYSDLISNKGLTYETNDSYVNKLIGNYSLMRSVVMQGNEIYVSGFGFAGIKTIYPVDITLDKGSHGDNDYIIKYNGSSSAYNEYGMTDYSEHKINTYGMKDRDAIDTVFDNHVRELSESFRVDIAQEKLEIITSGVSDLIIGNVDKTGVFSTGGSALIDCVKAEIEGNITNEKVDNLQKLVIDGNTYRAISTSISFGVCDGKYQVNTFLIDEERLEKSLDLYSLDNGKDAGFTVEDITNGIKNGGLQNINGLSEFVNWYNYKAGGERTDEYRDTGVIK